MRISWKMFFLTKWIKADINISFSTVKVKNMEFCGDIPIAWKSGLGKVNILLGKVISSVLSFFSYGPDLPKLELMLQ